MSMVDLCAEAAASKAEGALGDNNLKVDAGRRSAGGAGRARRCRRRARGGLRAVPRRAVGAARRADGRREGAVRERAAELAVAAATLAVPPAHALDRLRPAFEHRNWRARESALLCLGRTLAAQEGGGRRRPPPSRGACRSCSRCSRTASRPSARPPSSPSSRSAPASLWRNSAQFGAILSAHLPRPPARRRTATLATSSSTTCAAATCGRRSSSRCSSASASAAGLARERDAGRRLRLQRSARPAEAGRDDAASPVRPASARAGGGVSSHRGGAPPPLDEGEEVEPTVVYSSANFPKRWRASASC